MPRASYQRAHYDDLVRRRRPTSYGLSCGFDDRYDPALLERRPLLRSAWASLLDRMFPPGDWPEALLDLGCGTGYYWPLLAERCDRLVGVDLSPSMLSAGARHRQGQRGTSSACAAATADRLPFADGVFDAVLAVDVLHHADDLDALTAEARRVLRRGGRLVVVEPNVLNPVVLVAHLVPPEERGALWPNHPLAVDRALRTHFRPIRAEAVTYVSGLDSELALRAVEALEPLLRRPPLSWVALRRLIVARRRS